MSIFCKIEITDNRTTPLNAQTNRHFSNFPLSQFHTLNTDRLILSGSGHGFSLRTQRTGPEKFSHSGDFSPYVLRPSMDSNAGKLYSFGALVENGHLKIKKYKRSEWFGYFGSNPIENGIKYVIFCVIRRSHLQKNEHFLSGYSGM